jgi:hypothetical protein
MTDGHTMGIPAYQYAAQYTARSIAATTPKP